MTAPHHVKRALLYPLNFHRTRLFSTYAALFSPFFIFYFMFLFRSIDLTFLILYYEFHEQTFAFPCMLKEKKICVPFPIILQSAAYY